MSSRLAVCSFGKPKAAGHASGPGVGPDYRADVVDEDVLTGEYPGEHLQEHLEIRCCGMRHREALQLAGFLQLVDEVLERTCTCALPRLGFGETVSNLDDRLDRQ